MRPSLVPSHERDTKSQPLVEAVLLVQRSHTRQKQNKRTSEAAPSGARVRQSLATRAVDRRYERPQRGGNESSLRARPLAQDRFRSNADRLPDPSSTADIRSMANRMTGSDRSGRSNSLP